MGLELRSTPRRPARTEREKEGNMGTREVRGRAMEVLTIDMDEQTVQAIKDAESVLCVVFGYQTNYGSERCFRLRKALVDLVIKVSPQAR